MPHEPDAAPDGTVAPAPAAPSKRPKHSRLLHRLALAQAVLLVLGVLIALPFAIRSMDNTLWERQGRALYAFPGGAPIPASEEDLSVGDTSFLNIAAVDSDEDAGSLTLAISGHRICDGACPRTEFTFFSMADDAQVRRALPPSAAITLEPDDETFTQTIQLPVRGQPSLYPFDDYVLWLGLAGTSEEDGRTTRITDELLSDHAIITTQNQLRDYIMVDPVAIDPDRVRAENDPYELIGVQALRFERPTHLEILTVLLVVLIAGSAIVAVFLRDLTDLVFGIGSLILAIWGVRSVLVPTSLPVVTSVDLALSIVILFVLLGLALRAVHYFRQQSDLPPLPRLGRRK